VAIAYCLANKYSLKLVLIFRNDNKKLLEVANLNRPPPVVWLFLEEQDYQHNIEFNYMILGTHTTVNKVKEALKLHFKT
jgi:hypothetical protein